VPQAAGSDTLETELLQLVQEQVEATILSRFAIPDRFVIVPSIEKNQRGEDQQRLLRERYASAPV